MRGRQPGRFPRLRARGAPGGYGRRLPYPRARARYIAYRPAPVSRRTHHGSRRREGALEDRVWRTSRVLFLLPPFTQGAPSGLLVAGRVHRCRDGCTDTNPPIEQMIVDVPVAGGRIAIVGITGRRWHIGVPLARLRLFVRAHRLDGRQQLRAAPPVACAKLRHAS